MKHWVYLENELLILFQVLRWTETPRTITTKKLHFLLAWLFWQRISCLPLLRKTHSHLKKWLFGHYTSAQDGQRVNILFWSLQLCCLEVWGLAGRTTLSELQRALQMSLLCSLKLKRRKDGPLTTDSCQLDGTLTLSRPMSGSGGDKCLANQCAYKNHSPSLRHSHQHMRWQHVSSSTAPVLPTPSVISTVRRLRSMQYA